MVSACIVVRQVFRQTPACSLLHNRLELFLSGICEQPTPHATVKVWSHRQRPPQSALSCLLVFFQQLASDERLYAMRILLRQNLPPRCGRVDYGTGSFCRLPIQHQGVIAELSKGYPMIKTLLYQLRHDMILPDETHGLDCGASIIAAHQSLRNQPIRDQ